MLEPGLVLSERTGRARVGGGLEVPGRAGQASVVTFAGSTGDVRGVVGGGGNAVEVIDECADVATDNGARVA